MNAYRPVFGPLTPSVHTTRFRLWAPAASSDVYIQINDGEPTPMQRRADGWYDYDTNCGPGTRYRFRIKNQWVPDPASRRQDGDVHGYSVVVDPNSYTWKHADWLGRPWHETVLYELHAGLLGGFRGVTQLLPHLAELGVTAIELMPIAEFPGSRNWGYDGVFPFAPDASYGTPDELKTLIDTAHGLGLMVFLDVVYNHFGPDGKYLAHYAKSFFRDDIHTPWGPAIDFRQPQVRQFFAENALYWLDEFRFDGLRLDAVHAIHDDTWLDDMARFVRANITPERHIHLVLENDANEASHLPMPYDAQWNDDAHHVLHTLLTGEDDGYYRDYADDATARLARYLAEGFVYQGEPSAFRDGACRGQPSAHLPPTSFIAFLQNHDQIGNRAFGERLARLLQANPPGTEPNRLAAAAALLLLSPQIPLIFMGEEVGSTQPFLYFTSHNPELAKAVREGRRAEFANFKGFSEDDDSPIPDPNAIETFRQSMPDLQAQHSAAQAWRNFYKRTLAVRHHVLMPLLPDAIAAGATVLDTGCIVARWALGTTGVYSLYVNLSDQCTDIDEFVQRADVVYESRPDTADALVAGQLQPGCVIATLQNDSA